MSYSDEFSEQWDDLGCMPGATGEHLEQAKEAAGKLYSRLEQRVKELEKEHRFNMHKDELLAALAFGAENKAETVTLIHSPGGIGGITEVQKPGRDSTRKNITNYDCW